MTARDAIRISSLTGHYRVRGTCGTDRLPRMPFVGTRYRSFNTTEVQATDGVQSELSITHRESIRFSVLHGRYNVGGRCVADRIRRMTSSGGGIGTFVAKPMTSVLVRILDKGS